MIIDRIPLSVLLRSPHPELVAEGLSRLRALLTPYRANLLRASKETGIPHRTLCRWQETIPEVARMIAELRDH